MPKTLSVVLITLNEAANLPRTLASVRWAQKSSSSTPARPTQPWRLRRTPVRASSRSRGRASPRRRTPPSRTPPAIGSSRSTPTKRSARNSRAKSRLCWPASPAFTAYRIPRLNHFLGRPLRHGGYWPDPKLRLFRRGAARFVDRPVHETMQSDGPDGWLRGPLIHHCYPTLDDYIEHMNRYSTIAAQALVASGRARCSWPWLVWNALLNPAATFLYNYIFRLGFLDGRAGLLQHINHSFYIHWKYAKAWEFARRNLRS